MSAPNYIPENTALPTGHTEGLRLRSKNVQFNTEFTAFRNRWKTEFAAWLAVHDTQSTVVQTSDGQFVPIEEVEITPDGRIIHIGDVQSNDGDGGEEGQS